MKEREKKGGKWREKRTRKRGKERNREEDRGKERVKEEDIEGIRRDGRDIKR